MSVELIEVEPGKWRVKRANAHAHLRTHLRADLPMPGVISDIMPPTEQVDGQFYTSKSAFRRVGRQLGLIEIGTEKLKPKQKTPDTPAVKEQRRTAVRKAIAQYQSGVRPHAE
jgi:hypothetical protein